MRNAVIEKLTCLAENNEKIFLLVGDVGFGVVEKFEDKYPDRFLNTGIAEQNMMGVAAGLALSDYTVITYTFSNFTTFRCLEQIRNDICYHNLDVKIIGLGGGYVYGASGVTHHGTENVALMSVLPNMTVIVPCDSLEAQYLFDQSIRRPSPHYFHLRKTGDRKIYVDGSDVKIGEGSILRDGEDITLIGCGWILNSVLNIAEKLKGEGYSVRVVSMHTVKPLDEKLVLSCGRETSAIISVEEQVTCALGASIAKVLATSRVVNTPLLTLGIDNEFLYESGDQNYLLDKAGLSEEKMYSKIWKFLDEIK